MRRRQLNHQIPQNTLITDASVNPRLRLSGYGAWLANSDNEFHTLKGPLPFSGNSSREELYAIVIAAEGFTEQGALTNACPALIIQADNLAALQSLMHLPNTWAAKPKHPRDTRVTPSHGIADWAADLVPRLQDTLNPFDVVYLRHVKGHTSGASGRHKMNDKCDRLAKEAVQEQIA